MRTLLAPTEDFVKQARGSLSGDALAGSNVEIPVVNSDGVSINTFVVIGFEGNELAELCHVTATTPTSITVETLKFNHVADEPFVLYRYDKRKFYGSTSANGSFVELTADGSPKPISVDDPQGTLFEYTGTEYSYFKATYYNSITSEETAEDDSDAVLGDQSLRYATLYDIRKHAGLAGNTRYSDLRLEIKRRQAESEINSTLAAKYILPLPEVPGLISQICEVLAAGYIDFEEFGKDSTGVQWLAEGRALLKTIQTGRQLLLGSDLTELPRQANVDVLSGYPNTSDTDPAQFSMDDRF